MSDTEAAAEAPVNNPAEAKVEEAANAAPDANAESAKTVATESAKNGDKDTANGDTAAVKTEESADKKDNSSSERKFNDRRNGGYKGNGSFGGQFGGANKRYRRNNNTNEFENLPETDDPNEIRAQVEFYFSVANLQTDRHLFLELEGPRNAPVSIKHVTTFKRMRRFQPYSAVVNALRESETLEVVDTGNFSGAGKEAVKRKEPLVVPKLDGDAEYPPTAEELYERFFKQSINKLENCVYVKGFAAEGEEVGQIALEQFFRPYGAVMVRKRRDDEGKWKGSVFVEFDSEESTNQFLALEPKPKFNDNDLTIMSKKAYSEMKCKEKGITPEWLLTDEQRAEKARKQGERGRGGYRGGRGGRGDYGGRGRGRGGYGGRGRGGRGRFDRDDRRDHRGRDRSRSRDRGGSDDNRDWKKRRDNFQKRDDRDRDSKKRSRDDDAEPASPKRTKLEIKEDE